MSSDLMLIETISKLRKQVKKWRSENQSIALVPTMGALHDGHLSLVKQAQDQYDKVIISIFVNPAQFGKGEDLENYPRTLKKDRAKLSKLNADMLYCPSSTEIYPKGFSTSIHIQGITDQLCGHARPGHFDGVALIVGKLLLQALPDSAIFGEKDYQQLLVIRRLVTDLNIPVKIEGAPLIRHSDGLAMSSRNVYLSDPHRLIAPMLYQTLDMARQDLQAGLEVSQIIEQSKQSLQQADFKIDYFDLRFTDTLEEASSLHQERPARLFAATFLGKTRLIDNVKVT